MLIACVPLLLPCPCLGRRGLDGLWLVSWGPSTNGAESSLSTAGGAVWPPQTTANKSVTPGREKKEPAVATEFGVTGYTASLSL